MRRVIVVILFASLLITPLFAESSFPKAVTVRMIGVIQPRDVEIFITDEAGNELTAGDGSMFFEFPSLEEWEVSQTLGFSYSSHLANKKRGYLSFRFEDSGSDGSTPLRVSLELKSNDSNTIAEGNTFSTQFLENYQDKTKMGTLTVRIQKRITDIYKSGPYSGAISMTYTEES